MSTLRRYVTPLALIAAAILLYVEAPYDIVGLKSFAPSQAVQNVLTLVFWVLAIVVIAALFSDRKRPGAEVVEVEGPAFTRYLFSNTRAGLFWLPVRIFIGFQWLEAGIHKATGTGWLDGGKALEGFWKAAVAVPAAPARPPISFEWYRDFINLLLNNHAASWFSYLIVFGEIAIGVGLLVGALVGVAAFFGALMNMSFLLAGSASTNPVLFTFAIGLILAWRVAGYYGVDRYLLPMLGVPWRAKVTTAAPAPTTATA